MPTQLYRKLTWALLFIALPAFSFSQKGLNIKRAIEQEDTSQMLLYINALQDYEPMQDSLALLYHKLGGFVYKKSLEKAIEYTQQALSIRQEILPPNHLDLALSYYNLGSFYKKIKEYKLAISYFKKAVVVYKYNGDNTMEVHCYLGAGRLLRDLGDFNQSSQLLELAIQKAKENENLNQLSSSYLAAAFTLHESQFYEKSIEYLTKAEKYCKNKESKLVTCYNNFSRSYYALRNYKKAIFYGEKEVALRRKINKPQKLAITLNNLGLYYLRTKNTKKAKALLTESLALAEIHKLPLGKALAYDNLAEIELSLNQNLKALTYFHKATISAIPSFSNPDYTTTPSKFDISKIVEKQDVLVYLADKARASLIVFNETKETKYLVTCLQTYKRCSYLIDLLRQDHVNQESKLFWREKALPIYEKAIEASYIANDYEKAFFFFEKSKAILLLDAMLNAEALDVIQSDSLIRKESQLRKVLLSTQEKLDNEDEKGKSGLLEEMVKLNNEFDELSAQINKTYPNYHAIKYKTTVISPLEVITTELNDGKTTLLHYFLGEEKSWLYVLSKHETVVKELGTAKETQHLVANYLTFFENATKIINDPKGYGKAAFELYEHLIAPAELENIENLIIIPDGILGFVPFESLVTAPNESGSLSEMQYLIKDYSLRLSFSATILGKQNRSQTSTKGLLAFAPFSNKEEDGKYGTLPFSEDELSAIEQSIGGQYFKGNNASKSAFLNQIADFSVVHLSTHAVANEVSGQPFIVFSDTVLTLRELYGLNLPANLVVLSACQTNIGEVKSGEGVFSLSRGFTYAGAKSVIASLWNVNASSTGEIFPVFYENLKRGNLKSIALREAKLKYINAPSVIGQIKTPYDWAGFVLVGNNENISLTPSHTRWVIGGALFCMIFVVFIKNLNDKN